MKITIAFRNFSKELYLTIITPYVKKLITYINERCYATNVDKSFNTCDISRVELIKSTGCTTLHLQRSLSSSAGNKEPSTMHTAHNLNHEHCLPYAFQLISTKNVSRYIATTPSPFAYFTSRVLSYTVSLLRILSSSLKQGSKSKKPDKPLAICTAKRVKLPLRCK